LSKLKQLALKYASQGFHVFPLSPGSKIPMKGTRGLHDATTDPSQIEAWWDQTPEANIGIRTGEVSGISVVDFDHKSGGIETLRRWPEEAKSTFAVQTAGGGFHHYYSYDPDLKQTAGLDTGVDVRNDGGYVVGPGSRIGEAEYRVYVATAFQAVPEFIKEKQRSRAPTKDRASLSEAKASEGAENSVLEGGRNAYLTRIAGALRRQGFGQEDLEEILRQVNEVRCDPPLPEKEVATIAWSNARYEPEPDEIPSSTVVKVQDLTKAMNTYLVDTNRVAGETTGLEGLDKMLGGGLRQGEITALHAEAKTGKNTVMHRIILEFLRRKIPVGYASRELSPAEEVLPNLLSIEIGKNLLLAEEVVPNADELVADWPLYFAYGYGEFPLEQLEEWVENLSKNFGVKHFFLDHLHYMLMNEDYQLAARLIKKLKTLAKTHNVQMFLIIQPTKVLDGVELGLNTLKGGSAIGQTIDNLLTLRRVKDCENVTEMALTHARSRRAKPGRIHLQYDPETMDLTEGEILPPGEEESEEGQLTPSSALKSGNGSIKLAKPNGYLGFNWDSGRMQVE